MRQRARDLGFAPGILPAGPLNAITDVAGVRVGHATLIAGDSIRTGVTAIHAHGGNAYLDRVPAGVHVGNGFGKLTGALQVEELGELETPILLTSTLSVFRVADAMVGWMLAQPGMEKVRSISPLVGECNDSLLNDARSRPVTAEAVVEALETARGGAVAEGCVGGGTGTIAFGWKAGIGTSSRVVPGPFTVGVLVQSNFGGVLQILGTRVPREGKGDGSIIMVVATDAPLSDRNLRRLAARTMMGLARTGSVAANGSGDFGIAFSTAPEVRRRFGEKRRTGTELSNEEMNPLFQAVVEATEEAIYNSLFMAQTMSGNGATVEALPLDKLNR